MRKPNDLTVSDAMIRDVVTLRPDQDIIAAIEMMVNSKVTGAPVLDSDGKLVGIFSDTDGIEAVLKMSVDPNFHRTVEEFMSPNPQCFGPNDSLISVAEEFTRRRYRRFPVVENGHLVGQVSRTHVLREITKASRLK